MYSDSLADIFNIPALRTAHLKGESGLQDPNCSHLSYLTLIRIRNAAITP